MPFKELTEVPGIGSARAKLLVDHGIQTIADLKKMKVEDLASIKTVGLKNAVKIFAHLNLDAKKPDISLEIKKDLVTPEQETEEKSPSETPPEKEKKLIEEIIQMLDPKTFKAVRRAKTSLGELQAIVETSLEKLKPLGKKKWLKEYVEFKVHAKKLEKNLKKVINDLDEQPKKAVKRIKNASEELGGSIQALWEKIKRKRFSKVNEEFEEFRNLIRSLKEGK